MNKKKCGGISTVGKAVVNYEKMWVDLADLMWSNTSVKMTGYNVLTAMANVKGKYQEKADEYNRKTGAKS